MRQLEMLPRGIVSALSRPSAYPHDASAEQGVEVIQTHISHVFLTRDRVYKLRKAVVLPFLSFGTRAERDRDCLNELSLNRRLAPDVYLGISPIVSDGSGGWRIGAIGAIGEEWSPSAGLEHCVVMRRLPKGRSALGLLERGELTLARMDAVAQRIASFHSAHGLGAPAPWQPEEWLERVRAPVARTFELLRDSTVPGLDPDDVQRCEKGLDALFAARGPHFEARRKAGRVVDGHGDLHLDHVWFETETSEPIAIDCLEFDPELRRIDVAAELAFFAMDLTYRSRSDLAERFLRHYAALTDDFGLYGVVDYHILHRALVRASVAALAASQREVGEQQRSRAASSAMRHLRLVRDWLEGPSRGGLILTCGTVGTGKSTVASRAADALGAVVISSDRTRKRLAGLEPEQPAGAAPGAGIYTPAQSRRVYRALLERAEPVVLSGRVAVLDATFSREEWRQAARHWAELRGVPVLLLEVRCDEAQVLSRLAVRERSARHVSDAGSDFHRYSVRSFEPLAGWADEERRVVRTDRDDWAAQLDRQLVDWTAQERGGQPGSCESG
jgi:aminoglycoside phosphotransferase family enzyme/predicted kinase